MEDFGETDNICVFCLSVARLGTSYPSSICLQLTRVCGGEGKNVTRFVSLISVNCEAFCLSYIVAGSRSFCCLYSVGILAHDCLAISAIRYHWNNHISWKTKHFCVNSVTLVRYDTIDRPGRPTYVHFLLHFDSRCEHSRRKQAVYYSNCKPYSCLVSFSVVVCSAYYYDDVFIEEYYIWVLVGKIRDFV